MTLSLALTGTLWLVALGLIVATRGRLGLPRVRDRHASPAPIRRERTRSWRRRYRFRNGLEGRISQLKRKGLRRTRLRGLAGAQTWIGGITLAHNLQRIAILTGKPPSTRPGPADRPRPRAAHTPHVFREK